MADYGTNAEDVSAMMEALWGIPRETPRGALVRHGAQPDVGREQGSGGTAVAFPEPQTAPNHSGNAAPPAGLEASVGGALDLLRGELSAAIVAVDVRLNARLDALLAEAEVREIGPPDAELAKLIEFTLAEVVGVRSEFQSLVADQLDRWHERAAALREELARLEASDQASAERLAAVESQIDTRVAAHIESMESRVVTPADLGALRADIQAEMVEQLRLVLAEAVRHGDARAEDLRKELNAVSELTAAQTARFDAGNEDAFAAIRRELKDELIRQMGVVQTELQRRNVRLDDAIAAMNAKLHARLDEMATLVSTEAARAAERAVRHFRGDAR